jgi:hypothetical protein
MSVHLSDGSYAPVEAVRGQSQPQVMYNLTVADAHTFFVGEQAVLVHNTCDPWKGPTGQWHHVISNNILGRLEVHKTLKGKFGREPLQVRGADKATHNGYDNWHRDYDKEVMKWLDDNPEASPDEFLAFLQKVYRKADDRFPSADELLMRAREELP